METVTKKILYASHTFVTNLPSTLGFIPVGGQHVWLLVVVVVVVAVIIIIIVVVVVVVVVGN